MADKKSKKKDKYNGFTVPDKRGPAGVRACVHMYEMIKEAKPELLDREDVKKAYNDFVSCCQKYDTLESWIPSRSYKYIQNIKLNEPSTNQYYIFRGLNFRWPYMYNTWNDPVIRPKIIRDTEDIINNYIVLYDLIKRDVVPYMELKEWERTRSKTIESFNNQISRYEYTIKVYEKGIKDYNKLIEQCRTAICEAAKKAIEAQSPPEATKFD